MVRPRRHKDAASLASLDSALHMSGEDGLVMYVMPGCRYAFRLLPNTFALTCERRIHHPCEACHALDLPLAGGFVFLNGTLLCCITESPSQIALDGTCDRVSTSIGIQRRERQGR